MDNEIINDFKLTKNLERYVYLSKKLEENEDAESESLLNEIDNLYLS